jgi:hypothetical protein
MNIPLVTVTCQRDLQLLELQAQSFDRYLQEKSSIIIIVNELDSTEWDTYFLNNISHYYKRHNLTVLYKKDFDLDWTLFEKNFIVTSWIRQQILKLAISMKLNSKYYLILDSQNFLVNYWSFKSRFIDGKAPYRINDIDWAIDSYNNYRGLFGLSNIDKKDNMSICTPIYLNTDLVNKLILTQTNIKEFSQWFFSYGETKSEFALYLAWLEFNGGIEKYHYPVHNWSHPMLRDSFDFKKDVEYFIENLGKEERHRWSSINFRAWLDMNDQQVRAVVNKLQALGLSPNVKKFREEYTEPF